MELECGRDVLGKLPPLRAPNWQEMRQQAAAGCTLVLSIVAACLVATHVGTSLLEGWAPVEVLWTFRSLVYTASVVALCSLAGLMLGDPGVLERSERTCLPLPPEVAERLAGGEWIPPKDNIAQDGRTYCVRCLLWRIPSDSSSPLELLECFGSAVNRIHHCNTCQRCVEHFDHHCGVFGRCIAGRGLGGNMGYFKVIIGAGNIGGLSAAVCLFLGLSRSGQIGHLVAMALGGYLGVVCIFWTVAFLFWQLSKLRHLRLRGPSHCLKRSAGWRRFPSEAGTGSDIDTSPVDPVIFGVHR